MSLPSTVDSIHSITKTSHLNKSFFCVGTKIYFASDADYGELPPKVIIRLIIINIIMLIIISSS